MDKKINRLKRQQQRLWRKAAVSILSLHRNLVIVLSFLMIGVFGTFWLFMDHKLENRLLENARAYGDSITRYAISDLKGLVLSKDTKSQEKYLQRLTNDPIVISAKLFDHQGVLLASSTIAEPTDAEPESNTLTLLEELNVTQQDNVDKRIGILQLKMDRTNLETPIQELLETIALITAIFLLLAIFLAWLISKNLTKPLRKLLDFPIDDPRANFIEKLDVATELRMMLESSSSTTASPAPVSNAEASGIHQILAADSVAESADVIILKMYLCDLASWLKPDVGTPNVHLLRQLDRLLILTIHSQQGHLLSFKGVTAQACFGLDGDLSSAAFKAASCSLLLKKLLGELSLEPRICLRKEQRLLIRHMKRTPVAIPIHTIEDEPAALFSNNNHWLLLHKSICEDQRLLEQIQLSEYDENWNTIREIQRSAEAMIERQLTWIRHLLSQTQS